MFSSKCTLIRMILGCLSVALAALVGPVARAQEAAPFKSLDDLDNFTTRYFLKPEPARVPSMIEFLNKEGVLAKYPNAQAPFLAFFCQVAAANPKLVPEWKKKIEKVDPATRKVLEKGLTLKLEDLLKETPVGPTHNDILWGAYFATGDEARVRQIIDGMKDLKERKNRDLFLKAASGKWSLTSNAEQHPKVKQILEKARKETEDKDLRAALDDTLTKNHNEIRQEFIQVIRDQQAKGLWK